MKTHPATIGAHLCKYSASEDKLTHYLDLLHSVQFGKPNIVLGWGLRGFAVETEIASGIGNLGPDGSAEQISESGVEILGIRRNNRPT